MSHIYEHFQIHLFLDALTFTKQPTNDTPEKEDTQDNTLTSVDESAKNNIPNGKMNYISVFRLNKVKNVTSVIFFKLPGTLYAL